MKTSIVSGLAIAAMIALPISAAQGQTLGVIEQRVDRLEQSVRKLERKRSGGKEQQVEAATPVPASVAAPVPAQNDALISLSNRLSNMERMVSAFLAGQEQDRRTLTMGMDRLDRLKSDVESRLDGVEQQITSLANAPKPVVTASPPKVASVEDRYLEALGFAEKGEWAKAEFAFDTFVENNPNHARSVEAQYWLGRSLLGEGKAAQAAQTFLTLFEKHPDAPIAVDNLFALAEALIAAGPDSASQACSVYDQLTGGYSAKLSEVQRNKILDLRVKQNCH